ncbi:MAG: CSLREA domain-containing protein [Chloracidobacterium sp.]|nr:CSLREA domain-containing protein [Chloracidobacterium sp.]
MLYMSTFLRYLHFLFLMAAVAVVFAAANVVTNGQSFGPAKSLKAIQAATADEDLSATNSIIASTTAILTVTKTADTNDGVCDADCSLREALDVADSNGQADTIIFNIPVADTGCNVTFCTITLTSLIAPAADGGQLTMIDGGVAANSITLSGGGSVPQIFGVGSGVNLSVNSLNFTRTSGSNGDATVTITSGGNLSLTNSALYDNANFGPNAAIRCAAGGVLNLTNVTLSDNSSFGGGGINNSGTVTATNLTVTENYGGPFAGGLTNTGTFNISNSIIAGNLSNDSSFRDVSGVFNSLGYNLIGETDGTNGFDATGDQTGPINGSSLVMLAPLGFYGGKTLTHTLQSNPPNPSPAINSGTSTGASATDQRGVARVGNVDKGAFEVNSSYVAILPGGTLNTPYSFQLIPSTSTFSWSVTSGALPPGITLNSNFVPNATIVLSGTPTAGGIYNFTIRADNVISSSFTKYRLSIPGGPTPSPFVVNTTVDTQDVAIGDGICADAGGMCSLRAAISEVNGEANFYGGRVITLPAGIYTQTLVAADEDANLGGDFDITSRITINGAGAGTTIIQSNAVSNTATERVFHVLGEGATEVVLNGVTIQNGKALASTDGGRGGGIKVGFGGTDPNSDAGINFTLTNSVVKDNVAESRGGGLLINKGKLTVTGCTFTGNLAGSSIADASNGAGGIWIDSQDNVAVAGQTATITNTAINNNTVQSSANNTFGGGMVVRAVGAAITINGCTIDNNLSSSTSDDPAKGGYAGGIANQQANMAIINSSVSGNTSNRYHVGIRNLSSTQAEANLTIINSTVSNNTSAAADAQGGGITNISGDAFNATVTVERSTISGNTLTGATSIGGGFNNFRVANGAAVLDITNSTITGNSAHDAAGIYTEQSPATCFIDFSTITSNTAVGDAGGIGPNGGAGSTFLSNSIVADNTASTANGDIFGSVVSVGYNQYESAPSFTPAAHDVQGDPAMGALGNNGGSTQTQIPGLVARDTIPAGVNGCGNPVIYDQRGYVRPFGAGCDKGAVEVFIGTPLPTPTMGPSPSCATTITQSKRQVVTENGGIYCGGTFHNDNSFWRAFTLSSFGVQPTDVYNVASVSFGIELANAAGEGTTQPVIVRLYAQTSGTFPNGTRSQLATTTVQVADQVGTVLTAPISASFPAGTSQLIMEVFTPSGVADGHRIFIGANAFAQTGPSYFNSPNCGVFNNTTDLTNIYPDIHFVMSVNGSSCPAATATQTSTPTSTATSTPTPSSVTVSGTVTYGNPASPTTKFISNAQVTGTGSVLVSTNTAAPGGTAGQYTLTGFGSGSYTVSLSKTTGQNGVSSADAARIAQHVSGNLFITNDRQKIAADVTNNGALSSTDAAQLARFVAALGPPIGLTNQWRFFVPDVSQPTFPIGASPTTRSYADPIGNPTGQDFIGILVGEVTGNWNPTAARPGTVGSGQWIVNREDKTQNPIVVMAQSVVSAADKEIVVPVNVQDIEGKGVISYEFDLRYDPSVMQPVGDVVDVKDTISRGLSVVTNPYEPGLLRVVVYGAYPIDGDGVLLNLRFAAVGGVGSISDLKFENLIFNEGESRVTVINGELRIEN